MCSRLIISFLLSSLGLLHLVLQLSHFLHAIFPLFPLSSRIGNVKLGKSTKDFMSHSITRDESLKKRPMVVTRDDIAGDRFLTDIICSHLPLIALSLIRSQLIVPSRKMCAELLSWYLELVEMELEDLHVIFIRFVVADGGSNEASDAFDIGLAVGYEDL
jgi:hypothetical protein